MSAAAATATDAAPKKGKKKLIVLLAVVLVVLLAAAGGALFLLSKQAAHADDEYAEEDAKPVKQVAKAAPTFVALDVFTVNLADRGGERYAQIGVTLEVTDAKTGEQIKAFMPAIRNNILMVLAHKTSDELLQREGKAKLAAEIRRETLRPLGYEVALDDAGDGGDGTSKTRSRRAAAEALPVTQVHFSNFIIQ
jgi:flagellar FliL protein